jgi:arylsulfatase
VNAAVGRIAAVVIHVVFIVSICSGCSNETRQPSVILVCIDTLRADALGVYDEGRETSPHLDAVAREAVVFDNAYSVASWTKPAVPSLLTGFYPSEHGVFETARTHVDRLPESVVTLAESLQDVGYRTAAFVENVHLQRRHSGLDQGFGTYEEEAGAAPKIIARFFDWLDTSSGEPFFAYLHLLDPHWPYTPRALDAPEVLSAALRERAIHWDLRGPRWWLVRDAARGGRLSLDPPDVEALRALYDMEVGEIDAALGRMIELLVARGILDRAVFVVTADHGEGFYEHRRLDHGYGPYEELVRVPLIIRFPNGLHGGKRVRVPVQITAVAPTLQRYVGASAPAGAQRSALGLLDGSPSSADADVFFEERHGDTRIVDLRSSGFKYIHTIDLPAEPRAIEMPGDFVAGTRVQVEGVQVSGVFIAADVKLIRPGDTDCEVSAPLVPVERVRERFRILDSAVKVDPGRTRVVGEPPQESPSGLSAFAWIRAHGAPGRLGFSATKIEHLAPDAQRELEIEGVVDRIESNPGGDAWLHMCGRRIKISRKVTWRDFALEPRAMQTEAEPDAGRRRETVREELYDLGEDPSEQRDLSAKRPEILERMRERLDRFRQSLTTPDGDAGKVKIDAGTRRRLEAMGYLD